MKLKYNSLTSKLTSLKQKKIKIKMNELNIVKNLATPNKIFNDLKLTSEKRWIDINTNNYIVCSEKDPGKKQKGVISDIGRINIYRISKEKYAHDETNIIYEFLKFRPLKVHDIIESVDNENKSNIFYHYKQIQVHFYEPFSKNSKCLTFVIIQSYYNITLTCNNMMVSYYKITNIDKNPTINYIGSSFISISTNLSNRFHVESSIEKHYLKLICERGVTQSCFHTIIPNKSIIKHCYLEKKINLKLSQINHSWVEIPKYSVNTLLKKNPEITKYKFSFENIPTFNENSILILGNIMYYIFNKSEIETYEVPFLETNSYSPLNASNIGINKDVGAIKNCDNKYLQVYETKDGSYLINLKTKQKMQLMKKTSDIFHDLDELFIMYWREKNNTLLFISNYYKGNKWANHGYSRYGSYIYKLYERRSQELVFIEGLIEKNNSSLIYNGLKKSKIFERQLIKLIFSYLSFYN